MNKFKLCIAYDGTHYSGWQLQHNSLSIQYLIQTALETALRIKPLALIGSGRTDAGVHAKNQVAHFEIVDSVDTYRLLASLNGLLPRDIRILNIEEAPPEFHARYDVKTKIYHYHLHLDPVMDPFKRLYSFHVLQKIHLELLHQACQRFLGYKDFTSFANEGSSGAVSKNPFRHLYRLDAKEEEGGIRLELEADGFLYKMVRNIVGTLLDAAQGKIALATIDEIFQAKDRRNASAAVPPQGLFLVKVRY